MRRRRQHELAVNTEGAVLPCPSVDTLLDDAVRDRIVARADAYAALFVASLSEAESEDQLREAVSGMLLTFLAEVAGAYQ